MLGLYSRSDGRDLHLDEAMKSPRTPVALLMTSMIALFGLATSSADASEVLTVREKGMPTTLHPFFVENMVDERVQELIFDRLVIRDPITNDLGSRVLDRWEVVDDGREVRLTLKPGITWHDGEPLGAADVCFTIDAMLDPSTPGWKAARARESLESCTVEEDLQARVRFTRVFFNPGERLNIRIIPGHVFGNSTAWLSDSNAFAFGVRPVGTGPYKATFDGKGVSLEAYPNPHHGANIPRVRIVGDQSDPLVALRQLESNVVQGILRVEPRFVEEANRLAGAVIKSNPSTQWWYVAVNTNREALRDPRTRKALDMLIDRSELSRLSFGVAPDQPTGPKLISGPDLRSSPFYDPSVPTQPNADQAAAFSLLDSVEGVSNSAGRWHHDGSPIHLEIGMPGWLDDLAPDVLRNVADQLIAAGFDCQTFEISVQEWELIQNRRIDPSYDLLIGAVGTSPSHSRMLFEGNLGPLFHTPRGGQGGANLFRFSSPRVDSLLARFDAATTGTEARDARHELHRALADELPMLFLWELGDVSAWRTEVRGNSLTPYYFWTGIDGWTYAP